MNNNIACSACYGSGYGVDGKPCPCGCRPATLPAAPAPTEQQDELPITRSTYGSLEACEAEQARRNAAPTEQAGELPPLPAYELVLIKQYMVGNYLSVYRSFQMRDYARAALAARPAPTEDEFAKTMSDVNVTNIACMMGNMIYNLAQKKGHILTAADCEMFNNLREQWDAARQAPTEAPKDEEGNNYCRILTILGMEEEGDPVAEVQRLFDLARQAPDSRDAERLDWLIKEECMVENLALSDTRYRIRWPNLEEAQTDWFKNARDAIDAAIAQEKAQ
jgi:hypothetical protein